MKNLHKFLLQVLILLVPFYFVRFSIGPVPTTILEIYIYLIFIYFLFFKKINFKENSKLIWPALIFVCAGLISAVIDPDIQRGIGLWKGYFLDGFLIYLMFLSIRNEDDIIETIFYSGVLTSALALILYYSGLKSSDGRLLDLDGLSPNYIAMFLTPVLVLGIFHSFKSKSLIDYLSVMIILLALILTHSRGVIVGLAGGLIMGIFYYFKKIKLKFAPAILALMLAGFFIGGYLVFKPDWSDHARKATSSNVRYYIWSTSLEIAKERPILGVGLGNFQNYFGEKTSTWVNYPEFITPEALTAHDIFLHIFVVMGLIGFLVFIYFLYGSKFYSFHSLPVGIAIFSILFYGLVDTPFFRNDLSTIFWILMAISYKGLKNAKQT